MIEKYLRYNDLRGLFEHLANNGHNESREDLRNLAKELCYQLNEILDQDERGAIIASRAEVINGLEEYLNIE